ncbi:polysaccharide export protein [Microvirga tunisiensis]|uniref:Polysaccharide export protein n=3 Tax=Pannonibacter tanglangensis TaxID=2750084 RepID=A0A7X5F252_9HYPH|nr:polysaccharide export protein [Pannonibacter sp. XCT-34]NBN78366.1 polysaccharide export protein [Pannonibacter sp. XCT-53]
MRSLWLLSLVLLAAGCSALPSEGPSAIGITSEQISTEQASVPSGVENYTVIDVSPSNIERLKNYRPLSFMNQFQGVGGGGSSALLGVGDSLQIKIWEASREGLFSGASGDGTLIPATVDETGFIFVPYAGRIQAAGQSVEGLRQTIESKLVGKAIEPQVLVVVSSKLSSTAVVVGDVAKPGVYPLQVRNTRLLELVAQAGGARAATYETVVTLKRGARSGTTRLEHLIDFPENNVLVSPGDNVLLSHRPRTFSAFGAVKANQLVPFRTKTVSMAEALATVGGLNDYRADAGGIFLFRYEEADLVRQLRPDLAQKMAGQTEVPVVYRVSLQDPRGFFLTRFFEMRDKDILYVANHPTAEFGKFLQIIAPLTNNALSVAAIVNK